MPKVDAIVGVAGWEERFRLGLQRDLEMHRPSDVVIFAFTDYLKATEQHRADIERLAKGMGTRYVEVRLPRNPVEVWSAIRDSFSAPEWRDRTTLVDITTMPREAIYWAFSFLRSAEADIHYVYHRPGAYAREWLSRDTDRPRLVYQHSGISEFGKETCLLLVSGFDTDRAAQLMQFFEPRAVVVGIQLGDQFDNQAKNARAIAPLLRRRPDVTLFQLDAYSGDHGRAAIAEALKGKIGAYNVVAASLGPKPSAVALYRLHCSHSDIALVYAPSRQLSLDYSTGIGEAVTGLLDFESCLIDPFNSIETGRTDEPTD
jgi:hypothetical protein